MNYNYYRSPVGLLEFGFKDSKLCELRRVEGISMPIKDDSFANKVKLQLFEYFEGKRKVFNIPIHLKGTVFQEKVWGALLKIPYGKTSSYKDIAVAIDNENASRAVGLANGKNPIMIIVPCHRVISSNGKLNGYACGSDMKEFLLSLEGTSLKNKEI